MKKDQMRNWFRGKSKGKRVAMVMVGVTWVVMSYLAWLSLSTFLGSRFDASSEADVSPLAEWSGEWDPAPQFWGAWDSGSGDLQALPAEYLRLPVPRTAGEYVFIGGSLPWRGLDIGLSRRNSNPAELVCEHWTEDGWEKVGVDGTVWAGRTLYNGGEVTLGDMPDWEIRGLVVADQTTAAYWVRFSVTADLSETLQGSARIVHEAPTLLVEGWELRFHRRTACQNKQREGWSGKMISLMVLDAEGEPVRGVRVGFDTEPIPGVVYDHPQFWGRTDEDGRVVWDHLGTPASYRLWLEGTLVVQNIGTDFPAERCGTGRDRWLGNSRGRFSWELELQQQPSELEP